MKEKKHIHGFKIPKDYFENFEGKMFQKISENKIPQKNGFTVPVNYFDEVEAKILQKTNQEITEIKVLTLNTKKIIGYAVAIAACAVLIFSISSNNENNIDSLSYENLENYIEEGNLEMSTYDILALLDDFTVDEIALDDAMFAPDVLEDYILETMDESILTEEE